MNRILRFLHRKLDGYTINEYLIMLVCASIFLPFYIPMATIVIVLLYLVFKGKLLSVINAVPKAWFLLGFLAITTIVAYLSGNTLGGLCGIGMTVIFLFILFYRTTINPRLFEFIIDACCLVSLFCFVWSLMEYYSIVHSLDYRMLDLQIEDDPTYRINSTFFNANYYAMAIEFLILMCVYKMMEVKSLRRIIYYVVTIFCNLFALYLTGCRTAWVTFIFTIPLMFFLNKKGLYLKLTFGMFVSAAVALFIKPELFPRGGSFMDYLGTRIDIWYASMKGIVAHPLFGEGPLTYYYRYADYGGPYTQHAHSVYLDPLLSHGIIPLILFGIYLFDNAKEIWQLFSKRLNMRLFSLIISFVLTVFIHGILDYTIFWIQTSLLFFIVFSAGSMYTISQLKTSDKSDLN